MFKWKSVFNNEGYKKFDLLSKKKKKLNPEFSNVQRKYVSLKDIYHCF